MSNFGPAPRTADERFWPKVSGGTLITDCWEWTAAKHGGGYGAFMSHVENGKGIMVAAHRWSYERLIDTIPAGLDLDHLCRNRACVNPWHLEPVTRSVNLQRGINQNKKKTHCKRGHEFAEANTHWIGPRKSRRECITCTNARLKARDRRTTKSATTTTRSTS